MSDQSLSPIGLKAVMDLGDLASKSKTFIDKVNAMSSATAKFVVDSVRNASIASKNTANLSSAFQKVKNIASGVLVADVFKLIAKEVKNAANEALGAVADFQALRIQMDTLAARDYSKAFGVTISDALQKTAGASRELLRWVREIAVVSPFDVETLGTVLAMSQAYGFNSKEAKRLIFDTGELAAAWGLGNEQIQAMIYNFGQMTTQGKVTGYTLRNLARDMVPVSDIIGILAEKYGKTKAEITAMFKTGEIASREFISTFEELIEKDYPGAMERMSRTFTGAVSNFKDLLQSLVGYELLGPVADEVAGALQDAISAFLTPENYRKASNLGQIILYSFMKLKETFTSSILPAVRTFMDLFSSGEEGTMQFARGLMTVVAWIKELNSGLASGINELSSFMNSLFVKFGGSFTSLTEKMRTWGYNLIVAFANGMSKAIVAVINVINTVGRTIAKYLESHSPPLLLPELEQWGTNAMTAYMEGWKKANFDTFMDIGDILGKMIESWGGIVDEKTLISNQISAMVSLSKLTQEFQQFGTVSSAAIAQLMNSAGISSDELSDYITKSFDLTKVREISDAVSNLLDFKGVGKTNIFGTVVTSFEEIRALIGKFGPDLAGFVTDYINDSERLVQVDEQITQAQNEVNASTEEYTSLLDELEAQLNKITDRQEDITRIRVIDRTLSKTILTAYERERLELEKKQILVQRQIRDTKTEQQTEENRLTSVVDQYKAEKEALQSKTEYEKQQIESISEANVSSLENQLEVIKQLIEAQIELNNLYSKMVNIKVKPEVEEEVDTSEFDDLLIDSLGNAAQEALDNLNLNIALDELWNSIITKIEEKVSELKAIFAPVTEAWEEVKKTWSAIFEDPKFKSSWETFTSTIKKGIDILFGTGDQSTRPPLLTWLGTISGDPDIQKSPSLLEAIGTLLGTIVTNLFISTPETGKSVLQVLADAFLSIAQTLSDNKEGIISVIDSITEFMNDHAFPAFKDALSTIATEVVPALINFAIKAIPPLLDLLAYMVDHWKVILAVLGGFQVLGAGLKVGGAVVGGIAFTKLLKGLLGGGAAVGGGGLLARLFGGAAGGTSIKTLIDILKGPAAVGEAVPGAANGWVQAFPEAAGTGATGVTFGTIMTGLVGALMAFLGGAWLIELIKQEVTGEKGIIITTLETWGAELREAWAGSWFETTIDTVFGEGGWLDKFNTWISDTATGISDWANSLFGGEDEGATKGGKKVAPPFRFDLDKWLDDTFGPESKFQTDINTYWESIFGEDSSISKIWTSMFGAEGTLATTWNSLFGETGSIATTWNSIFGEEGSVTKSWNSIFGENGSFTLVWNSIFGAEGIIATTWISIFGADGKISTTWNSLFGDNGSVTKSWNSVFGTNGSLQTTWNSIFGSEGSITVGWNKLFGTNGSVATTWNTLFGTDGSVTKSWNSVFGSNGSIKSTWDSIFGTSGSVTTSWNRMFGKGGTLENTWNSIFGSNGSIATTWSNIFGPTGSLKNTWNTAFGPNGTFMTNLRNLFSGFDLNPARNTGKDIVSGIQWGIDQNTPNLWVTVTNLARNIGTWFNSTLGIRSPSTVFKEKGINIDLGLASGIINAIPIVKNAMESMMSSIVSAPIQNTSSIVENDNRVFVNMNPSYANYQSQSSVYFDTVAALSAIGR